MRFDRCLLHVAAITRAASRQLTTSVQSGLPAAVEELIRKGDVTIAQIPGAGRGLLAAKPLDFGQIAHDERPLVCHPTLAHRDKACYNCLAVLGPDASSPAVRVGRSLNFCSEACLADADRNYLEVEVDSDFSGLEEHCAATSQRFPLLIKRLACSMLASSRAHQEPFDSAALGFLSFVDLSKGHPREWEQGHALLKEGLRKGLLETGGKTAADRLRLLEKGLTFSWYCNALSRLHINAFRVDCIFPAPASSWRDAAASLAACGGSFSGTAVYTAASLLNHDCNPTLDLSFPDNDGRAVFTAARDIEAGEQLCIAYIDTSLPKQERQQRLLFGYGFNCSCQKCSSE